MYEIELKAWVDDIPATEEKINSFAKYIGLTEKHDTYWRKKIQKLELGFDKKLENQ